MTDNEIRIAIAEACGWEPDQHFNEPIHWHHKQGGYARGADELPDYLNDLNAMAQAEESLECKDMGTYYNELVRITDPTRYSTMTATARQRAEAFLRTIGKWKE